MSGAPTARTPRRAVQVLMCLIAVWLLTACGSGSGKPVAITRTAEQIPGQVTGLPPLTKIVANTARLSVRHPHAVDVFPIPGTRYNTPKTQISFRGIAPGRIGRVTVVGSKTGRHAGRMEPDADGHGASFLPKRPFMPGEQVTVSTRLRVLGGSDGRFTFTIEHPFKRPIGVESLPYVDAGTAGVQSFQSRPDLSPPSISVLENHTAAKGDIFLSPQYGPAQNGPMIISPTGRLIWFDPLKSSRNLLATDFRVQHLHGQRVLTWWQGYQGSGSGRGIGVIFNRQYKRIATVRAGNGLQADLHEFLVTPAGDAYVIATNPVKLPGLGRPVIDSVVQEIEIKTGLVLYSWDALDHIPPAQSYKWGATTPGHVLDPYHMNSVSIAPDGDLILSMRNTSAVYAVDHRSGQIIWRLGGKESSFRLGKGTATAFQHDVIIHGGDTLTIFDNGAGPPKAQPFSQGLKVRLNTQQATATLLAHFDHSPGLSANFEGSVQLLAGGSVFLGYGQRPDFAQFNAAGRQVYNARFTAPTSTYRAYRFPWKATPETQPALAVHRDAGLVTLYASWNGATGVKRWEVLGGATAATLEPVTTVASQGFESAITVPIANEVAVAAIGRRGQVLARSKVIVLRRPPRVVQPVTCVIKAAKRPHLARSHHGSARQALAICRAKRAKHAHERVKHAHGQVKHARGQVKHAHGRVHGRQASASGRGSSSSSIST